MKFQQLPMGARFEFEGKVYVKSGPISATAETGGQRMIPRYAVLRPLSDGPPMALSKPARSLEGAVVMAAFDAFCRDLERLLEEVVEKDVLLEAARSRVALARERFLAALGKEGKSDVQPVAREE